MPSKLDDERKQRTDEARAGRIEALTNAAGRRG